jgi:hypothetical protein
MLAIPFMLADDTYPDRVTTPSSTVTVISGLDVRKGE